MKKVLINVSFKDRYTGKTRVAGKTAEMSEERVAEIKEVNPNFITVIGNVENAPVNGAETADENADDSAETADEGKATKKGAKKSK